MRPMLPENQMEPLAAEKIAAFHLNVVDEVRKAVAGNRVVVVGMAQNPFCSRACRALQAAGVEYAYLEYGSYFSKWKQRLAIKLWSGWPTFPQVFVEGRLIGGFTELERWLAEYKQKK